MPVSRIRRRLNARSAAALMSLESNLDRILLYWLLLAGGACSLRLLTSPLGILAVGVDGILPYALLVLAPAASIFLALRWFADGNRRSQPTSRLALVGRWRSVSMAEAKAHPLYGASGIMVSLLIGILLNLPIRAIEFLTAMPPVPASAPEWVHALQFAMTLDVVLFSSLYGIAFVAALRKVPLFPRLLAAIWLADVTMQLGIARLVASAPDLPRNAAAALQALLGGNLNKVLISAAVWLPYLMISARVNVTSRHRVRA